MDFLRNLILKYLDFLGERRVIVLLINWEFVTITFVFSIIEALIPQ